MVIIETPVFTKLVKQLMSEDEYRALQEALVLNPDVGAVLRNSGGLRKIRWSLDISGKSGGIRVIYYWLAGQDQIYMLLVYRKNKQENLTDVQLSTLRKIVQEWGQ